jgi:hypothetical protein
MITDNGEALMSVVEQLILQGRATYTAESEAMLWYVYASSILNAVVLLLSTFQLTATLALFPTNDLGRSSSILGAEVAWLLAAFVVRGEHSLHALSLVSFSTTMDRPVCSVSVLDARGSDLKPIRFESSPVTGGDHTGDAMALMNKQEFQNLQRPLRPPSLGQCPMPYKSSLSSFRFLPSMSQCNG